MTPVPTDADQLAFLARVQKILDEGQFVATYKFALLIALIEIAVERGRDTGDALDVPLDWIAEKFGTKPAVAAANSTAFKTGHSEPLTRDDILAMELQAVREARPLATRYLLVTLTSVPRTTGKKYQGGISSIQVRG